MFLIGFLIVLIIINIYIWQVKGSGDAKHNAKHEIPEGTPINDEIDKPFSIKEYIGRIINKFKPSSNEVSTQKVKIIDVDSINGVWKLTQSDDPDDKGDLFNGTVVEIRDNVIILSIYPSPTKVTTIEVVFDSDNKSFQLGDDMFVIDYLKESNQISLTGGFIITPLIFDKSSINHMNISHDIKPHQYPLFARTFNTYRSTNSSRGNFGYNFIPSTFNIINVDVYDISDLVRSGIAIKTADGYYTEFTPNGVAIAKYRYAEAGDHVEVSYMSSSDVIDQKDMLE